MTPLGFFRYSWLFLVLAAMMACTPLHRFYPGPRVCLGKDWRTAIMDSALQHQASDSLGESPRYFQRELHIDRDKHLRPILVHNDSICTRALAEFDRVDPAPDQRPRTRGYVFLLGGNYVVRDPKDEEGNARWAFAAVFDNSWPYHFYQGLYYCPGGPLPATVDCVGKRQ